MKKILMTLVALLGLSLAPRLSHAMNPQDAYVDKSYLSHNVVFTSSDVSVAATIYYIGTSTEGTVQWLQGGATFYAPNGTVDTSVGDNGTSGNYNFTNTAGVTAANTIGKVCSSVNRSTNWRCVLGGLSSGDSSTLVRSTTPVGSNALSSALTPGGFTLFTSTGGLWGTTTAAGNEGATTGLSNSTQTFTLSLGIYPTSMNHRVVLRKCYANTNDGITGTFRVFGRLRQYEGMPSNGVPDVASGYDGTGTSLSKKPNQGGIGTKDDNTLVWQGLLAAALSDQTIDFSLSQDGGGLEFAKGAHVVVKAGNGTTVALASSYLQCLWDDLP